MILVCGNSKDAVTNFFCRRLDSFEADYRLLDLNDYPAGYNVVYLRRGHRFAGSISSGVWSLQMEEVTGVFVRNLYDRKKRHDKKHGESVGAALDAELSIGLDSIFADLECPVVNPFSASWSNHSKPYQATHIQNVGLKSPATLITNDLQEARSFIEKIENGVVYKSASGKTVGTHPIDLDSLPDLLSTRSSPIQLQERVVGADTRVHVVANQVFPTKVVSDLTDYRYEETERLRMEIGVLPAEIAAACVRLAQRLGLHLSGIDLRETPDGQFYCFEVNTQPGFAFYEQKTKQPISQALWQLLSGKLASA
jgi:glutathione synthase/RimK-type ligase-like ATP-grasp enzyme